MAGPSEASRVERTVSKKGLRLATRKGLLTEFLKERLTAERLEQPKEAQKAWRSAKRSAGLKAYQKEPNLVPQTAVRSAGWLEQPTGLLTAQHWVQRRVGLWVDCLVWLWDRWTEPSLADSTGSLLVCLKARHSGSSWASSLDFP